MTSQWVRLCIVGALQTFSRRLNVQSGRWLPKPNLFQCVFMYNADGTRIAASNTIESLMEQDFDLVINDVVYRAVSPPRERISKVGDSIACQ